MPYTPEECDPFRDGEGAFWSILKAAEEGEEDQYVLCAYRRLAGDYYYLYYMTLSSVETFYQTRFDTESVISGAEAVYDGYFVTWVEEDGEYKLFYGSPVFEGREQPADLGITGLDSGHVILGFCAECAEEDMDEVCDKVTGAIKALFEKHEIPFK